MLFNVQLSEINLLFNVVGSIKKEILLTSALRMLVKKSVNRMFFSEIIESGFAILNVTLSWKTFPLLIHELVLLNEAKA